MASVPAISAASILAVKDPQVREVLRAIADGIAIRNGDIGGGNEAFLTIGDLKGDPKTAHAVAEALAAPIAAGIAKPSTPLGFLADQLQQSILGSAAWLAMFARLRLIDAPDSVPGSSSYMLLQEAKARGAAITVVQNVIKTTNESLASTKETLTAAIGENAAAISTEKLVRADKDTALTQQITNVVTSTAQSFAGVQNALVTKTNNDNALASAINTMWGRVGLNSALISTGTELAVNPVGSGVTKFEQLQSVVTNPVTGLTATYAALRTDYGVINDKVTGLSGKWGVKIDLNGYVTGFGLNSGVTTGGKAESLFAIVADKFALGAPGRPDVLPFSIDAKTGLVRVDGNLLATGSVQAAGLAAYAVDRTKLALKAVGGAQIDDLAVDTLKIGRNAVTVPVHLSGFGGAGISAGTSRFAGSVTASYPDTVDVVALITWQAAAGSTGGNSGVSVRVNGWQFHYASDSNVGGYMLSHASSAKVRLGPGVHTFEVYFNNDWHVGSWDLGGWSVTLLGVMR